MTTGISKTKCCYLNSDDHRGHAQIGLWIIGGILTFMLVEKIFPGDEEDEEETGEEEKQVK